MRISPEERNFFIQKFKEIAPSAKVYLFGSRADDAARGGDIDILILSEKKIPGEQIFEIKLAFWQKFGEQKLDIVNYLFSEQHPFKSVIMKEAIAL